MEPACHLDGLSGDLASFLGVPASTEGHAVFTKSVSKVGGVLVRADPSKLASELQLVANDFVILSGKAGKEGGFSDSLPQFVNEFDRGTDILGSDCADRMR